MKGILDFLLVRRLETKDKWWHRLFLVLLFGSTVVVFVLTLQSSISNYFPPTVTPATISFTPTEIATFKLDDELSSIAELNSDWQKTSTSSSEVINVPDFIKSAQANGMLNNDIIKSLTAKGYAPEAATLNINNFFTQANKAGLSNYIISELPNLGYTYISAPPYWVDNDLSYNPWAVTMPRTLPVTNKTFAESTVGHVISCIITPIFATLLWILLLDGIYNLILYIIFGKEKTTNN